MDSVFNTLDTLRYSAQDFLAAFTSCLCQSNPKLKVNGRSYKIVRTLGEGGFSFVYLAQDEESGREFALKKIRCPTGQEGVKEAMREVEAYRRFRHPNIIRIMDSAVVDDSDDEGKIVYLFLPYYRRGNLQDLINSNVSTGNRLQEREILQYFLGACKGLSAMHDFRIVAGKSSSSTPGPRPPSRQQERRPQPQDHDDHESHDQDSLLPHPEGDDEGGFSYHGSGRLASGPPKAQRGVEVVFDGDEDLDTYQQAPPNAPPGTTEHVPYAHRDIKPANVMLADDGTPILMDFGSTIKARILIENRSQALTQQDLAAEQSSMPYRAPELFDVKTGVTLDEKVDIWSLGCLLFALAYNHSPFETSQTMEQGGSMAMAVLNAQYKHPRDSPYSEGFRGFIDTMLKAEPKDRPDIHQVIERTQQLLRSTS
ncbi:hypothetical protein FRC02_000104 [Tulasnella sp. 418]|nr:hypothetical protein FRC02_000104 [Tulasnella sp. 418]